MSEPAAKRLEIGNWRLNRRAIQSPITSPQSLILVSIVALAAFLRFHRLDASSLWSDEGNTWAQLGRNFGEIADAAAADIHPPGYYWLLKLWTGLTGSTAFGMRSFSALTGTLLVWVIYRLTLSACTPITATIAQSAIKNPHSLALLAALLAALNPFQIYYSQEARMYILLALEGAGLFWALLALMREERPKLDIVAIGFVLCGIAGLWTHYSFPIVLAAAALTYLHHASRTTHYPIRNLFLFLFCNLLIFLTFLPWLPIAFERALNWPQGGESITLFSALHLTLQTLLVGPLPGLPAPSWLWLLLTALPPLLGLYALRRSIGGLALALWLLAPTLLMLVFGLYSPAFLKFLLIASPAWCITTAAFLDVPPIPHSVFRILVMALGVSFAGLLAWQILPAYYTNPVARDNYAGVAKYIQAVGNPAHDLVILNAPGQQEVWRYYDPGLPVLALPQQRPPNADQTVATLASAVADRSQIFALFWATDEADPEQRVEQWLDQQAFQGWESWQGNLRFVTYSLPNHLQCQPLHPPATFGSQLGLNEQCQPYFPQQAATGRVALVGLRWQALAKLEHRYKVSVQLLDSRNQVIAQHDSEPGGGSQPTDQWAVDTTVADNHGLPIPFGTPPGDYRLIVAIYNPETGQRLPTTTGDWIELGMVQVLPAQTAIPLDVIPMQHRLHQPLGALTLIGYDAYRKGYAHEPATPLQPGDLVHFTFYWQAPEPLPTTWPADQAMTLRLGDQQLTAPLAGGGYPTGLWRAGEVVRGEFDLLYNGSAATPILQLGEQQMRLRPLPR